MSGKTLVRVFVPGRRCGPSVRCIGYASDTKPNFVSMKAVSVALPYVKRRRAFRTGRRSPSPE